MVSLERRSWQLRRMILIAAMACAMAWQGSLAWALGTLPGDDSMVSSERLPDGNHLNYQGDNPSWQVGGALASAKASEYAPPAKHAPAKSEQSAGDADLMGCDDLCVNQPLPDPAFEFRSGPAWASQPPAVKALAAPRQTDSAPQGFKLLSAPVSFSAGALGEEPPSRPIGARATSQAFDFGNGLLFQSGGPLFGNDGRLQEDDATGGFLSLKWRPAPNLGLTLGGGYQRSQTTLGSDTSAWQVSSPSPPVLAVRDAASTASYSHYTRLGAYLAMPYQLTEKMGLQPELTYYYSDLPDLGSVAGNEWVMGLQFNFGF